MSNVSPAPAAKPALDPVHVMIGLATIVIPPAIAYLSGLDWAGIAGPLGATTITGLLTIIRELATTELASVK